MKILLIILTAFIFASCNEDNPVEIIDSTITALEELDDVLGKARSDYSVDAKLAVIYGRNVSREGEVDLLKPTESAFIYGVQSDQKSGNEFYIPVYGAGPVKSPLNFTTIIGAVKDTNAKDILGKAFEQLSKVSVEEVIIKTDSKDALNTGANNGGNGFISTNSGTKIDMILLPGISIDDQYASIKVVWVIHYFNDSRSLVLLIDATNGKFITKISQ